MSKPVFVTITAPTCSGKSHLLNYIRDEAHLPCFISTTTRSPRDGERNGVDYYFISDKESRELELNNQFAELATYRGYRYGVTRKEFEEKLSKGLAFLIVEPSGLEKYAQPAIDLGALWFKYYIHVDEETQINRFKARYDADMIAVLKEKNNEKTLKLVRTYTDRLIHMLTVERCWLENHKWNLILKGDKEPEKNLQIILRNINNDVTFCSSSEPFTILPEPTTEELT